MSRARTGASLLAVVLAAGACQQRNLELGLVAAGDASAPMPDAPSLIAVDVLPSERGASSTRDGTTDGGAGGRLDGAVDACAAQVQSDPANCGACGRVCSFAHAAPLCRDGRCARGDCLPGFQDLNGNPDDGCEYGCTRTADGQEVCDDRDNDCDGKTDEETDKQGDVQNCGACGNRCAFLRAAARCEAGRCALGACEPGFKNANGVEADGCECGSSNDGVEVCDGLDNDCNGMVDDVAAASFQTDPQNCGACRRNCTALPHAFGECRAGACVIAACEFGYRDVDRMLPNGCEVACPGGGFEGGAEVCDGVDNDCDGKVDADDDSLVTVTNYCETRGECAGAAPRCTGGRWVCSYGPTVETTAPNQIVPNETWCDGKDNDCDGCVDETFPQVGRKPAAAGGTCDPSPPETCTDKGIGACQGRGVFACDPANRTAVTCQITTPGAQPAAEICDDLDNNCDGIVDNGGASDAARVKEPMVAVTGSGVVGTVYVYAYEASRPDATATSAGKAGARACARPGVLPWTNVTYAEATAACQAAGKRLCSEAEWQRACETAAMPACTWSFAAACTAASDRTCNTYEYDGDAMQAGDQDALLPTGSLAACHAVWGGDAKIFDLSGNAKEWTQARAPGKNPVRGGAYDTPLGGSTCRFDFVVLDEKFRYASTGFRCCSDGP